MLSSIEFEVTDDSGLRGAIWRFYLLRSTLVVDSYSEFTRASKRHKPKISRYWSRLYTRNATLPKSAVPFTPEIAERAKAEFLKSLEATLTVGYQA